MKRKTIEERLNTYPFLPFEWKTGLRVFVPRLSSILFAISGRMPDKDSQYKKVVSKKTGFRKVGPPR
jgi:hypothetical protein